MNRLHWVLEGGARWWLYQRSMRTLDFPCVYARAPGVVWRWDPAQAGTAPWVIEVMQSLEGAGWIGRALRRRSSLLAEQETRCTRCAQLRFSREAHQEIAAVVAAVVRGPSFEQVAPAVIFEAERAAFDRGDAWPLHLALASDRLRASLEAREGDVG